MVERSAAPACGGLGVPLGEAGGGRVEDAVAQESRGESTFRLLPLLRPAPGVTAAVRPRGL
jgi:hypothetical protein